jgi:hypothetical protein
LEGNVAGLGISNFPQWCQSNAFGPTAFTVSASDYYGYTIAGPYVVSIGLSDSDKTQIRRLE